MFDWEGEELANIIWGKTGEDEDHIVPYPDETYDKPSELNGEQKMVSASNATKLDLEHTDENVQIDAWANVGSFDDLDRILSNNEYGNANILCIDSPNLQLRDSRSECEHVETKSGFIKDVNTNLELMESSEGKNGKSASSDTARRTPSLVHSIGAVNAAIPGETGIGKMDTKGQKCDPWFSLGNQGKELERRNPQHMNPSSSKAINQETESSSYKQFINPLPSPSGYNNITRNQQFLSCEEQTSSSSSLMPLSMTPQEKIEKLRRRQQMRALLAIHKQQQEFRHQPSSNNYSNFTRFSNESQIDENRTTLLSLEKSDSDSRRMMMNRSSLEDIVLHQLGNVISTLDIQIRLCIRDSLFRLAQNALQRQYDALSSSEPNSTKSSARTAEGETKTNPIDRVVAHLLFHRPPELSGELLQTPSSGSTLVNEGSSRGLAFL